MPSEPPILEEGEVRIEIQKRDADDPMERFWARVVGCDHWHGSDDVRDAIRGAASLATDAEIDDALGDLWEGGV